MSNIKETNLEYFTEWNNAETEEDKIRVNDSWVTVDINNIQLSKYYDSSLYRIKVGEVIKRKRKTIVINGVEVVAPLYDIPVDDASYYWISPLSGDGFCVGRGYMFNSLDRKNVSKNGWFDNEADIRAFLAAIKGNTNE